MRSQFLTLLCVLTFLSCAWGLIDAVVSFIQTDAAAATPLIERTYTPEEKAKLPKDYFEDRAASGDQPMPGDPEQIRSLSVAQFGYSLLTLIGAVLMFRLRRVGFWVYSLGIVVGLIGPVALAGFGAFNTSFGVFFSIIFAGLYWYCLPEME
ncbi:hypothetical protein [Spirosoma montaniterrae]|uniref:DUF4386 domain-containing protein n=1 Tax=Spirosoma montaniterrae TaxID=1178516 RepID=A0A1P9X2T7_9BACT|nr:hypothetical protein [Spirosoma montaniterrae]AQG81946.1 hypothetical protein AWR27_23205 [Spirosoma montaniterrae]